MYYNNGLSCTITMVYHELLQWFIMYYYNGLSCTIAMVYHEL